jgi:hypothetical protein
MRARSKRAKTLPCRLSLKRRCGRGATHLGCMWRVLIARWALLLVHMLLSHRSQVLPRTCRSPTLVRWLLVALTMVGCREHRAAEVIAQLSVRCCTMACFPDGVRGHDCSLESLTTRLNKVAEEKDLRLGEVRCEATEEACNTRCESPPGKRLVCAGDILR